MEKDTIAEQLQPNKTKYFTGLLWKRPNCWKIMRALSAGKVLRQIKGLEDYWQAASQLETPEKGDEKEIKSYRQAPKNFVRKKIHFEKKEFNPDKPEEGGSWRNVAEHCLVVAAMVRKLGQLLHLSEKELETLTEAALIHDHYKYIQKEHYLKPIEELMKACLLDPEKTGEELYKAFDQSEKASNRSLRALGFGQKIRNLTSSVGHPSLGKVQEELAKIGGDNQPDWAMLALHWADDVVSNNSPVGLSRIKALAEEKGVNAVYQTMNEYGRRTERGQTLYEKQFEIGLQVEQALRAEVEKNTTIPENQTFTDFVVSQIENDIASLS